MGKETSRPITAITDPATTGPAATGPANLVPPGEIWAGEQWRIWQSRLEHRGHRHLVLITGSRQACLQRASKILAQLNLQTGLWTGDPAVCPDKRLRTVAAGQGRDWLGREVSTLVWDGWSGLPPDSLAAFLGTLRAGGLWLLLMPQRSEWATFADPDYRRTGLQDAVRHRFLARWEKLLNRQCLSEDRRSQNHSWLEPNWLENGWLEIDAEEAVQFGPSSSDIPDQSPPFQPHTTPAQEAAVADVLRVARGRARRPLLITARRGRGKSTALGWAARELALAGQSVRVTGPDQSSLRILAEACGDQWHDGEGNACVRFMTAEQVCAAGQEDTHPQDSRPAPLLIVDEAAALPTPTLKQILSRWPRVVLATTTEGYEGSGQGFRLRLTQWLDNQRPGWRTCTLTQPVRWDESDPLEPLVARLLLLDGGMPELNDPPAILDDAALLAPETLGEVELGHCFGLLRDAHYRTRPSDLRQWLDDPAAITWVMRWQGRPVALLWAREEGGLSPDIAEAVALGTRRPQGQLLPQSLAHQFADPSLAELRWLRVVRIVVHPALQQHGYARQLLEQAQRYAADRGMDGVGASFGATPSLVEFWWRCGYWPVSLGLARNASSGERTALVLRTFELEIAETLNRQWRTYWPEQIPALWTDLEADLFWSLAQASSLHWQPDARARFELRAFAEGQRGLQLSLPVLRRLAADPMAARAIANGPDASLWFRAVILGQDWEHLRRCGLIQGRQSAEQRLRASARNLLER